MIFAKPHGKSLRTGVKLTVETHRDPASLLNAPDGAGLALVDGISAESLHPVFAVLNEPFMYASHGH